MFGYPVYTDRQCIHNASSARYLGLHLDQRLTYNLHIGTKWLELNLGLQKLHWLQLSLANKQLICVAVLQLV